MSDRFSTIPITHLYSMILNEEKRGRILNIPKELFYVSKRSAPFGTRQFRQSLETPLGVAAGPHTQMAQNIIAAWLCGSRYMELKTIQTLDELEIPKPCIDIQDEGYNCEWSQELKIEESIDEYLNAWILIHLLHHKFGWEEELGTIFNLSIGYDLAGILKPNVQHFLDMMEDCSELKNERIAQLLPMYPALADIDIPDRISDNVTLSTMHGCPPDEIEKIGRYLMEERKYHTYIKLNPTLLGPERVRDLLNRQFGYYAEVPDEAFEHDLKYPDALKLINNLTQCGIENNVESGFKLTNTLEVMNHKNIFDKEEAKMMYLSGRALHPITVQLAKKLQSEFDGKLHLSFSAGADCFNFSSLIAAGLGPVSVCSDILKPGGYGRLRQYMVNLEDAFGSVNASNTEEFILRSAGDSTSDVREAAFINLEKYAKEVLHDKVYKKHLFLEPDIKTPRELYDFDCIKAPCVDACPTDQDIPKYLYHASKGDWDTAMQVVMETNPFPNVLGMVCDQMCLPKCTRINYDDPLLIRDIKFRIAESGDSDTLKAAAPNGLKAAIIGGGPAGLSCAYFLALKGFEVNVYETKDMPGGMVSEAIPSFRLRKDAVEKDVARIERLGVSIHYNTKVDADDFSKLQRDNNFIFLAIGAQKSKRLWIEGADAKGVIEPIAFLNAILQGKKVDFGNNIAVIGGGNTAMDVARTSYRLINETGKVTIVYRRTKKEMPAESEEVVAAIEENVEVIELASPEKILTKDGRVHKLICSRMELGPPDADGRARPVKIEGSEFELEFDTIVPAIGQDIDFDFIDPKLLRADPETGLTQIPNVYIGGDAMRGAATIVDAVGDGQRAAEHIIEAALKIAPPLKFQSSDKGLTLTDHILNRAKREYGFHPKERHPEDRKDFDLVKTNLTEAEAMKEAKRCLFCDDLCNVCVSLCPNMAMYSYEMTPLEQEVPLISQNGKGVKIGSAGTFKVTQPFQILNIQDFCNECGDCTTFCPTKGEPFGDKPRFCLTQSSFDLEETGYFIERTSYHTVIFYKENGALSTLRHGKRGYLYESQEVIAHFDLSGFQLTHAELKPQTAGSVSLEPAFKMKVLMEGALDLYPEPSILSHSNKKR